MVELEAQLDKEVAHYQGAAFATSTKKSYAAHRKSYLQFCANAGYNPVPASATVIARYIAFLARRLKYSSIRQYLNIIRILHVEQGLPNPLSNSYQVSITLRGVRRSLGDKATQKLPITPELLLVINKTLNSKDPQHTLFWGAALAAFYGMLRRSNIIPTPPFNPKIYLRRVDILTFSWGLGLRIRWSKTIQFRERELLVPLPFLGSHPLDPVSAILRAFELAPRAPESGAPFVLPGSFSPLHPQQFTKILKGALSRAGLDYSQFSGHSFRRGGTTWAMKNHFPAEVIKFLGDWKSDAYMAYVDIPLTSRLKYIQRLTTSLPYYS